MTFELNKRQLQILGMVTEQGFVTIESLANYFGISQQTIRRDLILMDQYGFLCRFHGGAGVAQDQARIPYKDKQQVAVEAKVKIGHKALSLLQPGMTIFIDVGTTAEAFAKVLKNSAVAPLRVVTASTIVANLLVGMMGVEVLLPGGCLKSSDGALTGSFTNKLLHSFRYDLSFISGSGFDVEANLMDFDTDKVLVKHAVIERSSKVVVLVDASKYRRNANVKVVSAEQMDCLVSDAVPVGTINTLLQQASVEILLA